LRGREASNAWRERVTDEELGAVVAVLESSSNREEVLKGYPFEIALSGYLCEKGVVYGLNVDAHGA
jgi:hypothetical protein